MKTIILTRFNLPNGFKTEEVIKISDIAHESYQKIQSFGLRLTIEKLRTGETSVCIENPELGDFDVKIVASDRNYISIIEDMLLAFREKMYMEWKEQMLD